MEPSSVPRTIGRYEVVERLGSGAAGLVLRARDPLIQRPVAIKTLHATRSLTPEQWHVMHERFMREAQTAGSLDHPNIVKIFDVGRDETGELYIVMECVDGTSLERILDRERMSPEAVLGVLSQVASALDAAHGRGIVHRDIKPANILFTPEGVVKITDFGIARITSSHLTQDVRELGTPRYMSPEQVEGKDLDGRADLFSLGVITYQLLTGQLPFQGDNTFTLAYQIVHVEPRPAARLSPELPPAVDRVLARVLHKDPLRRYANGAEFVAALRSALAPERAEAQAPPPPRFFRGGRGPWAAAGLVAALALAALVLPSLSGDPVPAPADVEPPPAPAAVPEGEETEPAPAGEAPAPALALAQVRFTHWTREGRVTLTVDGEPALTRSFSRGRAPVASHTWPLSVPAGRRRVGARVLGARGKVYEAEPITVEFSPETTRELKLKLGSDLSLR